MIIQGFLLDLDGVIAETSEFHYKAWKELAASLGISIGREFNEELKGVARMESLERILRHGGKENAYSASEKAKLAERKNQRYVSLLSSLTPSDILPGVKEFMEDIHRAGMKLAIASISRNAPRILEALELIPLVDYIADAENVPRSKPFPDIFLDAAQGIHCAPAHCVGVEDAAAGIDALHAAHMVAVGVGDHRYVGEAELVVPDTRGLVLRDILAFFT